MKAVEKDVMHLQYVSTRPEVRAIDAKIEALERRRVDLESRYERIRQVPDRDSDVAKLLGDPGAEIISASVGDAAELLREKDVVVASIAGLKRERQRVISEAAAEKCREFNLAYKKLVRRVLEAGRELAAANREASDFLSDLSSKGYSAGYLRPMQCSNVEYFEIFEKECSDFGFLADDSSLSGVVTAEPPAKVQVATAGAKSDWFE